VFLRQQQVSQISQTVSQKQWNLALLSSSKYIENFVLRPPRRSDGMSAVSQNAFAVNKVKP